MPLKAEAKIKRWMVL